MAQLATTDAAGQALRIGGGLIHHWVAGVFIPRAQVEPLVDWLKDYSHYASDYSEVEEASLLDGQGDVLYPYLRLRRKKLVTVHYDTEYEVRYERQGAGQMSSRCIATRIVEVENAGEPDERDKPIGQDSGFLWRLNAYWRFLQVEGGVIAECESLSLSRGIPTGLGWMVKGFVESVPREALLSTLTSLRRGALAATIAPSPPPAP